MNKPKFSVGQKLWYVPTDTRRRAPHEVAILKVGRKWLTIRAGVRVAVDTLAVMDGFGRDQCYVSREAWQALVDAERVLEQLYSSIGSARRMLWRLSDHIAIKAAIEAAHDTLHAAGAIAARELTENDLRE